MHMKIKLINRILTKLHGSEVRPKKWAYTNHMKFNFIRNRVRITPDAVIYGVHRDSRLRAAFDCPEWPLSFCTDPVRLHLAYDQRTVNRYISTSVLFKGIENFTMSPWTANFLTIKIRPSFENWYMTVTDMNDNNALVVFGCNHVTHVPPFYARRQLHLLNSGLN